MAAATGRSAWISTSIISSIFSRGSSVVRTRFRITPHSRTTRPACTHRILPAPVRPEEPLIRTFRNTRSMDRTIFASIRSSRSTLDCVMTIRDQRVRPLRIPIRCSPRLGSTPALVRKTRTTLVRVRVSVMRLTRRLLSAEVSEYFTTAHPRSFWARRTHRMEFK